MNLIATYILIFILGAGVSLLVTIVLFAKLRKTISKDFIEIANYTIKNEQEDLRKQHREILEDKILPLTTELKDFKEKVDKFNISGVENTVKIIEQLGVLERNNKILEQEAKNLTDALTKNQNIKGAYGEEILDTILQSSGMIEGVHYTKQFTTVSENLKDEKIHNIRPDIIINLPDNKHIIVDSKVTLSSYLECIKDNTKIKNFKSEIKRRLIDLAEKNYNNANDINQPDFIIMYLPIESSLSIVYEDNELINLAYKNNIIISGTASLLAAIRLVNQLFAQKKQNENVKQIVDAGTNLYETFSLLCEELIIMQKDFNELSQHFTTTINRFQRQNKNKPSLFSQIEELKKLGISTNKKIPDNFLEEILIEDGTSEVIK